MTVYKHAMFIKNITIFRAGKTIYIEIKRYKKE